MGRNTVIQCFAIVQTLAERSLASLDHNKHLYEPNNGNFLSQVEQIPKFHPAMKDFHVVIICTYR
jgi:hypothetical protein